MRIWNCVSAICRENGALEARTATDNAKLTLRSIPATAFAPLYFYWYVLLEFLSLGAILIIAAACKQALAALVVWFPVNAAARLWMQRKKSMAYYFASIVGSSQS
jgi:hypothetical protein